MNPVISHGNGFGKTFRFIIAAANPNAIDMPPITLLLGMHQRVAINLGG
jgi:hypothetical protein